MSYRNNASKNALADLGASINLMPHSLFLKLGISELKPTKMGIQLADRSTKYPIGICENLLVKTDKFIFLIDFVILEMDEDASVPIILGRPFLATTRVVIDVYDGKLSLRVGEERFLSAANPGLKNEDGFSVNTAAVATTVTTARVLNVNDAIVSTASVVTTVKDLKQY
ncbi:reverse transcriptase domain-containing protein [Tanacetum coccineum]